jgi:signal transduction histidine kinase/Tfp pilus assembly protein PilF
MKDYSLIFCFVLLSGILLISCSDFNKKATTESIKTDSVVKLLHPAAYNNPDSVLTIGKSLLHNTKEPRNQAKLLLLMASAYELTGNYDSSINLTQKGLKLNDGDAILEAKLYNQLGVNYDYKSDYRNALENYQIALEHFQEAKDTIGYLKEYNNIGIIYWNSGDLQRAKDYLNLCLKISREKQYADEEIMAMSNLASVYNELKQYDTALLYFKEVLQSDLSSGNESYIASSYHNIADTYKNLHQFDSSTYYFKKAIALKEKLEMKGSLANSYKQFADLLIEIGKLNEAAPYLERAFTLSRETGATDYLKDCFYIQSRLAEKQGNFKTAYAAADSFHRLKDSLSNTKFRTELVVKEKDHELAAGKKLRAAEQKEFESEKVTFILFIVLLLAVLAILLILFRRQKVLNKQLKLQKQQIEEGLALRTQLLSFIAHEIRNPLGGIIGLTDLLLTEEPTDKQKELLEYQKKASTHLLSLMNDVLDYQKLGSGKLELNNVRFNLRDVLYQVYALYQTDIRDKKLSYDLDYDDLIPSALNGDPVRLTQVFSNLLNNAIKFTEKGTITISAQLITKTVQDAVVFFQVSDSGIGIPKDEQEKIFELYVQSSKNKSAQLGTGLGLSIVKNLLSLMNSKIELESEPGSGTTFSFTITFRIAQ